MPGTPVERMFNWMTPSRRTGVRDNLMPDQEEVAATQVYREPEAALGAELADDEFGEPMGGEEAAPPVRDRSGPEYDENGRYIGEPFDLYADEGTRPREAAAFGARGTTRRLAAALVAGYHHQLEVPSHVLSPPRMRQHRE